MKHPLLWLSFLALLAPADAGATPRVERLHLDEVVPSPDGGADVELYLRAETRYGEPVEDLGPQDLAVRDNGDLVPAEEIRVARLSDASRGATISVALDVSRTMKGEPFDRAKAAVLAYIDRMGPDDRLSVITFSDRVEVPVSFKATKSEARERVREIELDRQALTTVLFDGVFKAVDVIRRGRDLPTIPIAMRFPASPVSRFGAVPRTKTQIGSK